MTVTDSLSSATTVSNAASSSGGTSKTSPTGQLGEQDFLKLLVAQLGNQDPMQPMDNTQFVTQLAQFDSLQRMQSVDDQMGLLLKVEQLGQANGLIGKQIEATGGSNGTNIKGTVDSVNVVNGSPVLSVDGQSVNLTDVVSVVNGEAAQLAQASNLIGKQVQATVAGGSTVSGLVDSVQMQNGNAVLMVNGQAVQLSEVNSVTKGS